MAWINALDVEGATLVCRTQAAPTVWVDALAVYSAYFSVADGVITVQPLSTNGISPNILEVGVQLPVGYLASNTRVSVTDPTELTQITPPVGGTTAQMQGALVTSAGDDIETANMSLALTPIVLQSDITSPTEIGEIADNALAVVVSVRAKITPP